MESTRVLKWPNCPQSVIYVRRGEAPGCGERFAREERKERSTKEQAEVQWLTEAGGEEKPLRASQLIQVSCDREERIDENTCK